MSADLFHVISRVALFAFLIGLIIATAIVYIPDRKLKWSFAGLCASVSIWINLVFLVEAPGLSEQALIWIFRSIFACGGPILLTLTVFVLSLTERSEDRRLQLALLCGVPCLVTILALSNSVVSGIQAGPHPVYGTLHPLYLIAVACHIAILFSRLGYECVRSKNSILKYQMSVVLYSFAGGSLLIISTNIIYPLVTGASDLSKFGPYLILLPIAGVSYILIRARRRLIWQEIDRILESGGGHSAQDNFNATHALLQQLANLLNRDQSHVKTLESSVGAEPDSATESYTIRFPGHRRLRVESLALTDRKITEDRFPPAMLQSVLRNAYRLEVENRKLYHMNLQAGALIEQSVSEADKSRFAASTERLMEIDRLNKIKEQMRIDPEVQEFFNLIIQRGLPDDFPKNDP